MRRVEKNTLWFALGLAALLALSAGSPALAEDSAAEETQVVEPTSDATAAEADGNYVPVTFAGMKVYVDQETGRMRPPTASETQQLARQMRAMFKEKRVTHQPVVDKSGSMSLVVAPDHLNFTVARIDDAGQVHMDCAQDLEEGLEVLEHTAVSQPQEIE